MCVYEHACEEQRLTSRIFLDCSPPYVLGRVSQFNPELNSSTSLAFLLWDSHLCLPSAGMTNGFPWLPSIRVGAGDPNSGPYPYGHKSSTQPLMPQQSLCQAIF